MAVFSCFICQTASHLLDAVALAESEELPLVSLGENLRGCTFRALITQSRDEIEKTFNTVATYHRNLAYHTYIIDPILSEGRSISYRLKAENIYNAHGNYTLPVWILNRHTTCYAHLYFVETQKDLNQTFHFHFVDLTMRHDEPTFIIIWELDNVSLDWSHLHKSEVFFGLFMDYRIHIKQNSLTTKYEVNLMCVICREKQEPLEQLNLHNLETVTPESLERLWKSIHSKHLKNVHGFSCYRCVGEWIYENLDRKKEMLMQTIGSRLNMTESILIHALGIDGTQGYGFFTSHGHIANGRFKDLPDYIGKMLVESRAPSYIMAPGFQSEIHYKFFTTMKASLLIRVGWTAIFFPFPISLWMFLMTFSICLILILRKTSYTELTTIFFSVTSQFTDHWWESKRLVNLRTTLTIWSLACYLVTILYGGALIAIISAPVPPPYPQSVEDLQEVRSKLMTTTHQVTVDSSWMKTHLQNKTRMISILRELDRNA